MGSLFSGPKIHGVDIDLDSKDSHTEIKTDEKCDVVMFDNVKAVIDKGQTMLELINEYEGCQSLARAAMSSPSDENEKAAFEGLLGCVNHIVQFCNYSKELGDTFTKLLTFLAKNVVESRTAHLDRQQQMSIQFAEIIDFALHFDNIRMLRPNLSNDFSYYRRLLPKFNMNKNIKVKEDEASGMVMFCAEHIPMTRVLIKAVKQSLEQNSDALLVLSTMANSCMLMLKKKKFSNPDITKLCARAMAGSIVIFDHNDEIGSFAKKSPIGIKDCANILKKEFPDDVTLINAIRYSTKNFREAPTKTKALFE